MVNTMDCMMQLCLQSYGHGKCRLRLALRLFWLLKHTWQHKEFGARILHGGAEAPSDHRPATFNFGWLILFT